MAEMRILIVAGSIPPMRCGIGDYTAELARTLSQRADATVAVLTDVAAAGGNRAEGSFEVLPVAHGWKASDLLPILQTVRRWRPDLIHIQYPGQGYGRQRLPWLLPELLSGLRLRVVQTWHEYYRTVRGASLNLLNIALPGTVVVVRPNYAATLSPWLRRLAWGKRFHFVPNASAIPVVHMTPAERSAVQAHFNTAGNPLVVYFGFAYPEKGVDLLFQIADPTLHHLVIVGNLDPADPYHQLILETSRRAPWADHVTITGFVSPEEAARVLACADAVVLPFRSGGGPWNTSLQAAAMQGTFVLTSSAEQHGYSAAENTYYARLGDVQEMQQALQLYQGRRNVTDGSGRWPTWESIASQHMAIYRQVRG